MITVVGNGILGLSVAEFFSRNQPVQIVFTTEPLSGSQAAGASLSTKAQLFARDPHFALKLNGKAQIESWISSLLAELKHKKTFHSLDVSKPLDVSNVVRIGDALEVFANESDCDAHESRLRQDKSELQKRNLPAQPLTRISERTLRIGNEGWVDARLLLEILQCVLASRGVRFVEQDVVGWLKKTNLTEDDAVIFCTGAWTSSVFKSLGLQTQTISLRTERITCGSTLDLQSAPPFVNFQDNVSMEFHSQAELGKETLGKKTLGKATLGGINTRFNLGSTTVRLKSLADASETPHSILGLEENLWRTLEACTDKTETSVRAPSTRRMGLRVGFGHSEIVVERIDKNEYGSNLIVCAGAHKSGFLLAPIVGQLCYDILKTIQN